MNRFKSSQSPTDRRTPHISIRAEEPERKERKQRKQAGFVHVCMSSQHMKGKEKSHSHLFLIAALLPTLTDCLQTEKKEQNSFPSSISIYPPTRFSRPFSNQRKK
mmetsp:Transcript_24061/g.47233  ORF Transcript_24061/g.47233 Transcript_24061/m.47233 type:complete len:105 (-) Transcript_24061:2805-3119(-)